jgi:cell division transport system permease protein
MGSVSIKDIMRSFARSWVHHTGMQLATLSVLTATFTVVVFVIALSLNMKRVLTAWGDNIEVTAYLKDEMRENQTAALQRKIEELQSVSSVKYVARETATASFKSQMATYAPDLLSDSDFMNPFPASFRVTLKGGVDSEKSVQNLEQLAGALKHFDGVEDVSYGQSWVKTYSAFFTAVATSGGVIISILLLGGLFVIGNSIRASIGMRREEIEILELIGATASMIRRPYVTEGFLMGATASILALLFNMGFFVWESNAIKSNLAIGRLSSIISFVDVWQGLFILIVGSLLGALGAWLAIRRVNDGWSAAQQRNGA